MRDTNYESSNERLPFAKRTLTRQHRMTMILRAHSMTYVAYRLGFTNAEVVKSCFTQAPRRKEACQATSCVMRGSLQN